MFAPVVVVVLISLGTLARGRPRITAALLHAIGVVLVLLIGAAAAISAAIVDVRGGTEWQGSQAHVVLFASALLAVLAAFYHWAPKLWGRHLSEGLGILSFLALLVGAVVAFAPGYLGLRDQSRVLGQNSDLDRFTSWNRVAAIGSYVLVAGILLFLVNLLVSVVGRKGAPAENDPWNGHSLEWHASSPPVAHNFDTIPEIRSEQPVLDLHAVREEVSV
jgi:heme/copper-type cytochrome/quinol oxidase subunit 1